jgi:hypothetical protein
VYLALVSVYHVPAGSTLPAQSLQRHWVAQSELIGAKIVADQTTYGVQLVTTGANVRAANVGITGTVRLNNADVLDRALVQGILDADAVLQPGTTLLSSTTPERGLYTVRTTGGRLYFGASPRIVDTRRTEIHYATSFVAVDQFGRIAGVWNDQTYPGASADDKSSKWILGDAYGMGAEGDLEWFVQSQAYGEAIVKNQGLGGFTNDIATATNVRTDDVAGVTINLLRPNQAIAAAIPASLSLRDGVYFAQDADDLFVYVVVDGGRVEAVFVDQIDPVEQAVIADREGNEFPLFTYDKQTAFGSTIEGTPTLVYLDRGVYYEVIGGRVPVGSEQVRVTFRLNETQGINEEATLAPVAGNFTAKQNAPEAWLLQSRLLTARLDGQATPYRFNLDAAGMSDTEIKYDGEDYTLILNALAIRDLVEEALLKSNAAFRATTATARAAQQYSQIAYESADLDANQGMANGIWFGATAADVDGQVFLAYAVVEGGEFKHLIIDGTRAVDGEVKLLTVLRDAEYVALGEEEDGEDDFYETIAADISVFQKTLQRKLVTDLVAGYDFTSRGIFGVPAFTTAQSATLTSRFGAELLLAAEAVAKPAIDGLVRQAADELGDAFKDLIISATGQANTRAGKTPILYSQITNYVPVGYAADAGFVLSSDPLGKFSVDGTNRLFSRVSFESSNRSVLDVDSAGRLTARRLEADGEATITMTVEFDGQVFTYSTTYEVLTVASYNRQLLALLHTNQNGLAGVSSDKSVDFNGRVVLENFPVALESLDSADYTTFAGNHTSTSTGTRNNLLISNGFLIQTSNAVEQKVTDSVGNLWNSGLQVSARNSGLTGNFVFGYFLNYGQSTERAIRNLSDLEPGSYNITVALKYDTILDVPQIVTRRLNVTIISEANAITRVLAEIKPDALLNDITTEAAARLDNTTSVIGVSTRWSVLQVGSTAAGANSVKSPVFTNLTVAELAYRSASNQQQLTVQRNYSDEKFVLRANLVRGQLAPSAGVANSVAAFPTLTGTPQRNFELNVKAVLVTAEIAERIEEQLEGWMNRLPSFIELPAYTGGDTSYSTFNLNSTSRILAGTMFESDFSDIEDITSSDSLRYAISVAGTSYYVVPAAVDLVDEEQINTATLSGITHYVVYRQVGTKDVSSGFASLEVQWTGTSDNISVADRAITLQGAPATANDLPFLVLNAVTGELFVVDVSELVFPVKADEVTSLNITITGRILLSTDSVPTTKQVNSSAISRTITLFRNPSFGPLTNSFTVDSGTTSVTLTLSAGAFANVLTPSMFTVVGTANTSGVDAAAVINAGFKVVRESDILVRIYGYSGVALADALEPNFTGEVTFGVKPNAIRTMGGTLTAAKSTQVGVATVSNTPKLITLTSGSTLAFASGVSFVVDLDGDLFDASEFTAAGKDVKAWLSVNIGGVTSGLSGINGLTASGVVSASSGSITITFSATSAAIKSISDLGLFEADARIVIAIPANNSQIIHIYELLMFTILFIWL